MARFFRFAFGPALSLCVLSLWSPGARAISKFTPAPFWSRSLVSDNIAKPTGVAVDPITGTVIVVGYFSGTANLGGPDLTSAGSSDVFIAGYRSDGILLFSRAFGGTLDDNAADVCCDGVAGFYVTGSFGGTVSFGGTALVSNGATDIFVCKFNVSSGSTVWSKGFGGTSFDDGLAVAANSANVYITGDFSNTVNFGGSNLVSAGGYDIFVAKLTSSGVHSASIKYGSTSSDFGTDIAIDNASRAIAVGYFQGSVNFGGGALTSAGNTDMFVVKTDATSHFYSKRFGNTGSDLANGVTLENGTDAVVTGQANGSVDLGGGSLSGAGINITLARYDTNGAHVWSKLLGGAGTDAGVGVAKASNGDILLTGYFSNVMDLGGGSLPFAGNNDIFLARFTSAGVHKWSQSFGNASGDDPRAVACATDGSAALVGTFLTSINFGGSTDLVGASTTGFIATFGPDAQEPVISSISDIGNDQGRMVRISFGHSGADHALASDPVVEYEAYRRNDAPPSSAVASVAPAGTTPKQLLDTGWTFAGSVPAHARTGYSIDAPTIGDSTLALGLYRSVFKIRAATAAGFLFHDTAPDSGYSVDNLAPGVPQNLVYGSGTLSWNESGAKDFDFFTVYGGNTSAFPSAVLINYSTAPTLDVHAATYPYYFVTATDFSGNEGRPALLHNASGVGETPRSYVLSLTNYPNPFNPRTTVKYTVPSRGMVDIQIFDASGARVATLFHGERNAGAFSVDWDGRTENAAIAASGIYFARIAHNGVSQTRKMMILK